MAADRQDPGHTFVPPPQIDLSTPDWSAEERAQVMAWYAGTHGPGDTSLVPFVPFMIEHNPAGFKRLRQHSVTFGRTGSKPYTYAPVVLFTNGENDLTDKVLETLNAASPTAVVTPPPAGGARK